jgi:hypothetical protein
MVVAPEEANRTRLKMTALPICNPEIRESSLPITMRHDLVEKIQYAKFMTNCPTQHLQFAQLYE